MMGQWVLLEPRVLLVFKELKVNKEHQDQMETMAEMEFREELVPEDPKDLQLIKLRKSSLVTKESEEKTEEKERQEIRG